MTREEYIEKLCEVDHQKLLYTYISKRVCGHQNIEDLRQDTNIKVIEKYSSYKETGKFRAWICTIAFWIIRAYKKKPSNRTINYCGDIMSDQNVSTFDYFEGAEVFSSRRETERMLKELEQPLQELFPIHGKVFGLMLKGYKPAEIAKKTRKSVVSIYKIRTRAFEMLKEKVERKRNMKRLKKGVDLWGKHLRMESEN